MVEIKTFEQSVRLGITGLLEQDQSRSNRRTIVKLLKKANFGCAILQYRGTDAKFIAFSSFDDWDDYQLIDPIVQTIMSGWEICTKKEANQQRFKTLLIDDLGNIGTENAFDRNQDTESKILEAVATYLDRIGYNRDSTGTLYLYTDRKPCDSCENVIGEFSLQYPSLTITILHGGEQE